MVDRVGICWFARLHLRKKVLAHGAIVRVEIAIAQPFDLAGAEDDDHILRRDALNASELLGVETKLQREVRFGSSRELRVPGLIPLRPKIRWLFDADKEIADTVPVAINEHTLIDNRGSSLHRVARPLGVCDPGTFGASRIDADDVAPLRSESIKPRTFVFCTLCGEQFGLRIAGLAWRTGITHHLEGGQVLALQEVVKIAGREDEVLTDPLHSLPH